MIPATITKNFILKEYTIGKFNYNLNRRRYFPRNDKTIDYFSIGDLVFKLEELFKNFKLGSNYFSCFN